MTPLFRPLPGRRLPTALWWCLWFAAASIAAPGPARADDFDLALVLAVDVSSSIDSERYELQRRGYAEAFRSPEIIAAIRNGTRGAIAVTLMEWAGPGEQRSVIDWTVLHDEASARRFGSALAEAPRVTSGLTAIGDALAAATARLDACEHRADRRVIDVSGDGASNAGRRTDAARDGAIAAGITINGLPIQSNEPDVEDFYRQNVIGGQGAFLIAAQGFDSFAGAILDKLLREIAAAPPSGRWSGL
jgi:uncharacterized protein DUF1194